MKKFIFTSIMLSLSFILFGCAEEAQKSNQVNGNNVAPTCSGLTIVARLPNLPQIPTAVFTGYVNNVIAFDECNGGNKNGFTFTRPSGLTNGAYEFVLSNPSFPFPQPNHQVNLRFEARFACGGAIQQGGSRTITLEDRGGCYGATFSP